VRGKGLRQATGFLTVVPGSASFTPAMVPWFPLVGAALGAAVGGVWWAATEVFPAAPAAAVAVVADIVLTGALHHDGLVDSADGLLPHLARDRRLEVMREPTIGAFGVFAAIVTVLVWWSSMATLEPAPLLLAALWALSRATAGLALVRVPHARADGLAATLAPATTTIPLIVQGALAIVAASVWHLGAGLLACAGVIGAGGAVVVLARRRLGGITGDVLGAAIVLGEAVGLLLATVS
jgi:adenosylcobinamide-GDP ribazoletransferase